MLHTFYKFVKQRMQNLAPNTGLFTNSKNKKNTQHKT